MNFILFLRAIMAVLAALSSWSLVSIIVFSILGALGLWFIAWCLAVIGDATGERKVLGMLIVSLGFSICLMV